MNDIARRLNEKIEQSNLSYADLEKLTGISKSALQRYATGVTEKIPIDRLELIAPVINTTAAYLMGWEEENSGATFSAASSHTSFIDHDPLIDEIITLLGEATPEQLASVIRYIKFTLQDG